MTLFEGSQMCCFLRSALFSILARGASQGYAPQSGIIGILKQLMSAQKEEEDRFVVVVLGVRLADGIESPWRVGLTDGIESPYAQ